MNSPYSSTPLPGETPDEYMNRISPMGNAISDEEREHLRMLLREAGRGPVGVDLSTPPSPRVPPIPSRRKKGN